MKSSKLGPWRLLKIAAGIVLDGALDARDRFRERTHSQRLAMDIKRRELEREEKRRRWAAEGGDGEDDAAPLRDRRQGGGPHGT